MTRLSATNKRLLGRIITRELGRGRLVIDPDVVPELVAYLLVLAEPYQAITDATDGVRNMIASPAMERHARHAVVMVECIHDIIQSLERPISRSRWQDIWYVISEQMGISYYSPDLVYSVYTESHIEGSGI